MTSREARRERRAAERKTKKAEIRRTKADLLANPDLHQHATEDPAPASATENGFVSQNGTAHVSGADDDHEPTLLDWIESARRRNFPNGFPEPKPAPLQPEFACENDSALARRAAINRANAQLSTGPITSEGQLASSRNSTKHGLAASVPLIPGEDPVAFDALLADLLNDHQPANATEKLLVTQMAQSHWLEQRAIRFQNSCFTEDGVDQKGLSLYLRYGTTHNRAFHKALSDLQRLHKDRRKAECVPQSPERGFVSQSQVKTAASGRFVSQSNAAVAHNDEFLWENDPSADPETRLVSQIACESHVQTL